MTKRAEIIDRDELTALCTSFETFDALINAEGNYFPSLNVANAPESRLADYYDHEQEARGDARRAHRYSVSQRKGQ